MALRHGIPVLADPSLAASLEAFYLEHRLCGELEGGVEEGPAAGQGGSRRGPSPITIPASSSLRGGRPILDVDS